MTDKCFSIPAEFWRRLSNEQMADIMFARNGRLNAEEARLLWRLMKRQDEPPKAFQITTISPGN